MTRHMQWRLIPAFVLLLVAAWGLKWDSNVLLTATGLLLAVAAGMVIGAGIEEHRVMRRAEYNRAVKALAQELFTSAPPTANQSSSPSSL